MKILRGIKQNLLAVLSLLAFVWWATASTGTSSLAFYVLAVLSGGYYLDWARRKPDVPLKAARNRIYFDAVIIAVMAVAVLTDGADVLMIAGGVIFVILTTGADVWVFTRARKLVNSKKDSQ